MATIDGDTLTITIPNPKGTGPEAKLTGVPWLTWKQKRRIGSASQKETEQGGLTTDLSLMFDALVKEFADSQSTRGQIHDHKGNLIPFAPDVVDEFAHVESVSHVALELGHVYYPEIFGEPLDLSAEGENEAPAEEPETSTPTK